MGVAATLPELSEWTLLLLRGTIVCSMGFGRVSSQ